MSTEPRICAECKQEFRPEHRGAAQTAQRFCSILCRGRWWARHEAEKRRPAVCVICGGECGPYARSYCSMKCQKEGERRHNAAVNAAAKGKTAGRVRWTDEELRRSNEEAAEQRAREVAAEVYGGGPTCALGRCGENQRCDARSSVGGRG